MHSKLLSVVGQLEPRLTLAQMEDAKVAVETGVDGNYPNALSFDGS
jgi:hypothetical protein